jgi:hypothetical protein
MRESNRELPNDSNPEVITLMSEEELKRRLAEIVRRATTDWTPPSNEEIDAERERRKQEKTLQNVGRALLRTWRRLS